MELVWLCLLNESIDNLYLLTAYVSSLEVAVALCASSEDLTAEDSWLVVVALRRFLSTKSASFSLDDEDEILV